MVKKRNSANVPKVDVVEPFFIGNFCHKRSLICLDLMDEVRSALTDAGWDGDFSMYYDNERYPNVRLYFRISSVSNVFIQGLWPEIKDRLPDIVPLVIHYRTLRLSPSDITACWIEPHTRDIDWANEDFIKYRLHR